jgi:hypothetical protein
LGEWIRKLQVASSEKTIHWSVAGEMCLPRSVMFVCLSISQRPFRFTLDYLSVIITEWITEWIPISGRAFVTLSLTPSFHPWLEDKMHQIRGSR